MSHKNFSRANRVAKSLHRDLASVIQYHSENLNLRGITITAVTMSKDLSFAKIFVTVLDDSLKDATVKTLNKNAGFFRMSLAKSINLRVAPKLMFVYDTSVEYGMRLSSIIDKVVRNDDTKHCNEDEDDGSEVEKL